MDARCGGDWTLVTSVGLSENHVSVTSGWWEPRRIHGLMRWNSVVRNDSVQSAPRRTDATPHATRSKGGRDVS